MKPIVHAEIPFSRARTIQRHRKKRKKYLRDELVLCHRKNGLDLVGSTAQNEGTIVR